MKDVFVRCKVGGHSMQREYIVKRYMTMCELKDEKEASTKVDELIIQGVE